jgi:hypothetical protein
MGLQGDRDFIKALARFSIFSLSIQFGRAAGQIVVPNMQESPWLLILS